jgi:glycosyltransferase involved in cell wall biosynthesis
MAVYNGEPYLHEALESILQQSFGDFEFLIINDGSTDRTREIVLSYSDPRICLLDNPGNLGLTRSLNRGLALARGEFVARQDADDISEPQRLARQVAFLQAHPEVALLGTWYTKINNEGTLIAKRKLPCDYTDLRWRLLFSCPFVHSCVMLRKAAVLEQIGFYNEDFDYSQDFELWRRIARRLPVANLNEYLGRWRENPGSMTSTYGSRTREGVQLRIATVADLLGWDPSQVALNEMRFRRMTALLYGSPGSWRILTHRR